MKAGWPRGHHTPCTPLQSWLFALHTRSLRVGRFVAVLVPKCCFHDIISLPFEVHAVQPDCSLPCCHHHPAHSHELSSTGDLSTWLIVFLYIPVSAFYLVDLRICVDGSSNSTAPSISFFSSAVTPLQSVVSTSCLHFPYSPTPPSVTQGRMLALPTTRRARIEVTDYLLVIMSKECFPSLVLLALSAGAPTGPFTPSENTPPLALKTKYSPGFFSGFPVPFAGLSFSFSPSNVNVPLPR